MLLLPPLLLLGVVVSCMLLWLLVPVALLLWRWWKLLLLHHHVMMLHLDLLLAFWSCLPGRWLMPVLLLLLNIVQVYKLLLLQVIDAFTPATLQHAQQWLSAAVGEVHESSVSRPSAALALNSSAGLFSGVRGTRISLPQPQQYTTGSMRCTVDKKINLTLKREGEQLAYWRRLDQHNGLPFTSVPPQTQRTVNSVDVMQYRCTIYSS